MTEKQFQAKVMDLAKQLGWLVYHTHDSRRSEPGFPDLVLVKGNILLFRELKTDKGQLTKAQADWGKHLDKAGDWDLWRPCHWDLIVSTLTTMGRFY